MLERGEGPRCPFCSGFNVQRVGLADSVCLHLVSPEATDGCLRSTCGLLASGTQTSALKGRTIFLNLYIDLQVVISLWELNAAICMMRPVMLQGNLKHIASFLSVFKLVLIGLIIVGKDPFAFFGMQAPSIWQWGQENKVYACMMVFFLSNMIENQCMSTGAFEITLNDVPVWSKLESGHLPSMQQLVQILDNEMKLNVHMESMPHHRS
nr:PREDICTED: selenoprotein T isoform X1 [Struthio camelus australis]